MTAKTTISVPVMANTNTGLTHRAEVSLSAPPWGEGFVSDARAETAPSRGVITQDLDRPMPHGIARVMMVKRFLKEARVQSECPVQEVEL